jgi:NAD(P)-dependent dehydrogenase (short-subunit alcohol dehydrogenase family)
MTVEPGRRRHPAGRLHGKIALVTGAARGIGAAIAGEFAAEGAFVIVTDIDEPGGHAVAGRLGVSHARFARLDVREEADWERVVGGVLVGEGRLDILINNAGITGFETGPAVHDPENATLADWRAVHATNLDGVFLGCRAAIQAMRRTGEGAIVNIASRSGLVGVPGAAAYAASKAAVRNHTKTVALYCAEQGLKVRCNAVHPGAVLTPMWDPLLGDGRERETRMAAYEAETPLRRFGRPGEVAAVCVLLASDEATYITGADFCVDGGLTAGTAARPG